MTYDPPTSIQGAILLGARLLTPHWKCWPSVEETLALVGASKSQSYEMLKRLWAVLASLVGRPGRPPAPAVEGDAFSRVSRAVLRYVYRHPGAVRRGGKRCSYSDGFRRFVVGLVAPGRLGDTLSPDDLAQAIEVPLGTLKTWLHPQPAKEPGHDSSSPSASQEPVPAEPALGAPTPAAPIAADDDGGTPTAPMSETIRDAHLKQIATLWPSWQGTFEGFCEMLRRDQRIPFGYTFIANFLQSLGLRAPRPPKPVQSPWSRQTFRTFFPGAQWLGDGTSIAIHCDDEVFVFNVEAILDSHSNALLGFHVSDAEDEQALLQAYRAALETTGAPPLALTLDNRPSNHTPAIQEAVDAILLRATPDRGEAKAPLEGAFGLFQQSMPPFILVGSTPRDMARSALQLVLLAWARGRNGRPRGRLGGLSPAEAYTQASPTPEEIRNALDWIRELQQREERARCTREARRDPARLRLLDQGLAELGIADPGRRLAVALAGYAPEAIAYGLATLQARMDLGTLPTDPGRYLGGIIRQHDRKLQLLRTSEHLLKQRIRLRDLTLEPLHRAASRLRVEMTPLGLPQAFVDQALDAAPTIDFRFWAGAAAEALAELSPAARPSLYRQLCRRIAASFRTDRDRRDDLIVALAEAATLAA